MPLDKRGFVIYYTKAVQILLIWLIIDAVLLINSSGYQDRIVHHQVE